MPQPYVTASYMDAGGEVSTVSVYLPDIDADGGNYEDIVGGAPSTVTKIVNGIGALTACTLLSYSVTIPIFKDETPADPPHWANREYKLLITYTDDGNGRKYSLEIPAPDTTVLVRETKDNFSLTEALLLMTDLLNNNLPEEMVSRDGNAVTWRALRGVGRNI